MRIRRVTLTSVAACLLVAGAAGNALAAPGDLDPSFGGDGKTTTDLTAALDSAHVVAIQTEDGKIVVGGQASGNGIRFAVTRYNPDGTLDTTFSGDGKVLLNWTPDYDSIWGLALQPSDGKIVVSGDVGWGDAGSTFGVARFDTDGKLDTTFSGDGKQTINFTPQYDSQSGLAIQEDGKILVTGGAGWGTANTKFAVARLNPNGDLDTSFSGDGKVLTDITGSFDHANAVAVEPEGGIVVGGFSTGADDTSNFALVRYTATGTLDTSFNGDGKQVTSFTVDHDSILGLGLQVDGKILAVGNAGQEGPDERFALARYNTNGSLDTSFSADGKVMTQVSSGADTAREVQIQDDGKILAIGSAGITGGSFAVVRYLSGGGLDTSFGGDGKVTTNLGPKDDSGADGELDQDGNLVVVGVAGRGSANAKFAVVRYLTA